MIAAQEMFSIRQNLVGSMSEVVSGFAFDGSLREQICHVSVEGDLSQAYDDFQRSKMADLRSQMRCAVPDLLWSGLIPRRSATDDRGDPGVAQTKTVILRDCTWLVGESGLVKDGIHEVSGTVSREGATSAVGSMGTWSQPKDENARPRVAEPGYRTGPVDLIHVSPAAGLADASTVGAEAIAGFAGDNGLLDTEQIGGKRSGSGASHSNYDIRLVHSRLRNISWMDSIES
jgi:hypothetical protein